jgi:hypothetical protein
MLNKPFKYFLSVVILLHCIGVTQLVSAYSKNNSAFVGMINMNEEETKKEKESKDDTDYSKDIRLKFSSISTPLTFIDERIYFRNSKNRINYQFIIELPTPPPDSLA